MSHDETKGVGRRRVLRLPEVLHLTGLKKTSIYTLQARGEFPMRVRLSPASVGWIEDEVQAWIEQRIADRVTR
jgi:prophage regulatory protein